MQIKKDEVRFAILKEAEKEFLQKGFIEASVRKVAKAAGTTIGNFYNYFDSKEALFEELVKDEYRDFISFIENHNKAGQQEFQWENPDTAKWREELALLIQAIMPMFSDRFLLLIEGSKGTKFQNVREMLLNVLEEHFVQHISEFSNAKVSVEMGKIISHQVLNGIVMILKRNKDDDIRKELLTEHLLYHIMGVMGLLGLSK